MAGFALVCTTTTSMADAGDSERVREVCCHVHRHDDAKRKLHDASPPLSLRSMSAWSGSRSVGIGTAVACSMAAKKNGVCVEKN